MTQHPADDRAKSTTPSSTDAVHAGEARFRSHDSLTVPIVQTSVYTFPTAEALVEYTEESMFWDEPEREEYGRYGNPTVRAAEAKLAALEGGQDAVLVSSGMGAVTSALFLMLSAGDHMILTDECYHSTLVFCETFIGRYGVECSIVAHGDYAALEAAIQPNTKLIFSESPTDPFMHCVDLDRLVAIAKHHKVKTVIDTTFATPVNMRPLDHGIDLVIHSVTKYLAGHNDLMAGVLIGSYDMITPLRQAQGLFGQMVAPHTAYLILRGVKTLALRVERQNANGLAVARYLEAHPKVRRVWYPGLRSHRDHGLAEQTMRGAGGVVSFEIEGEAGAGLCLSQRAEDSCHRPQPGRRREHHQPAGRHGLRRSAAGRTAGKLGIRDELIRFCIGIEETADLIADLAQALEKM